ncbi:RNA polymerase sigma-70 factor [Micromonospora halophytica]|uniref:RNA polymerase sigma-70 factor, ECF subfamily n=1 Tax=Micromonospora halophytica TaxID=47864 RepID=A0A1C5JLE5_9ACTN|nr:RNA polymerase sigma-70 factor [Micromonospora halophytica]SCG71390.1 RNA polymerase sigma-70 factor, ECF subfamily [Micromonospora halophytica]
MAGTPQTAADRPDPATDVFLAHRNLLFTVAYEMLGSAADAEDVLQETWLRWAGVDLGVVRDQRAYLVRITTRQALGRLRTLGRRKESYFGPWLPEPLLTAPDVAEDVALADSVSMAMLMVLETLAPTERAVFVLREVFDLGYDEIAEAVDKTPAAVRQIAHRARAHVAARRPRQVVSAAETRGALDAFRRAVETGDLQGLLDILAPDVVLLGDGGGVKQAVPRPILGADKVARLLAAGWSKVPSVTSWRTTQVNGHPALILHLDGELDTRVPQLVVKRSSESGRRAAKIDVCLRKGVCLRSIAGVWSWLARVEGGDPGWRLDGKCLVDGLVFGS